MVLVADYNYRIDRSPPPTPTPLFSASKYLNDAAIALESNDFEAVRTAYEALVETRPTEPTSYIRLAELSLMNQKVEDSLSYAQRAVEVAPDNPDALAALARAYDWQGEYDTALQFALDGFDIDPLNPNVLAVLGEIYTDNLNFPTPKAIMKKRLSGMKQHYRKPPIAMIFTWSVDASMVPD